MLRFLLLSLLFILLGALFASFSFFLFVLFDVLALQANLGYWLGQTF